MEILNFVKSLLPHMGKDQVLEDLRTTSAEITEIAMPTYRHASEFFRSNKFKSEANLKLQREFYSKFDRQGGPKGATFIGDIDERLVFLKENLTYVEEQIEVLFERDIFADGLTARKALLIRAAEHLSFISRMSLDVLNYVYTQEAREAGADLDEGLELSPAELRHVESNIAMFGVLVSDYGIKNDAFEKILGSIPEVMVNEKSAASVAGVFNNKDIDPFKSAFVSGFVGNPIYHIRLLVAQFQVARYKANKDKKRMLELRLLHLELLKEKKNDPKVEQEIEYTRNRVNKIDKYLREVEESVEAEA